jgi:transcriptional regulator with XRE-family HTH domain
MVELYENIKKRRMELGMTQTELANKVGYSDKGMISKVENGKVDIPQSLILKFAKALDTTPGCLMGWSDQTSIFIEPKEPQGDREEALNEYAKRLYEHYQKASPEIQKAVDLLLKSDKQP